MGHNIFFSDKVLAFRLTDEELTDRKGRPVAKFEIEVGQSNPLKRVHRESNIVAMLIKANRIISRNKSQISKIDKASAAAEKRIAEIDASIPNSDREEFLLERERQHAEKQQILRENHRWQLKSKSEAISKTGYILCSAMEKIGASVPEDHLHLKIAMARFAALPR